jgi:hypothetical protein
MSNRRDPFKAPVPATHLPSLYDARRVAAPRKRNRQWEKQHQSQKAVYRGIDPKLALKVKSIAGDLAVPDGKVARALLEHALHAYTHGDLDLCPRPNPDRMRMTLFPASDSAPACGRSLRSRKRKQAPAVWRVITTWRGFPPELKREIAALASEDGLNVPVGELITALLRFGLMSHDSDLLKLEAEQKATPYTLAPEGAP